MATCSESSCPITSTVIRFCRKPAAGWAALTALFGALLTITWRRWPDPLIDFGYDLYIPWLMNQGTVLYRDIEHSFGPLTQSLHALLFRAFGASFTTLAVADAFLAGLLALLIYRIILVAAGRGIAFLGTLIYVAVFAFGNYTNVANYSFICPFSHEATHGFILCMAALHAWQMAFARKSLIAVSAAGIFTGLCFLTRAETFVAALAVAMAGLVLWNVAALGRKRATAVAVFCFSLALPLAACLALAGPRSTLGAWYVLLVSRAPTMIFYRNLMGTDTLGANLAAMGAEFAGVLLAGGLVVYLGLRLGDRPKLGAVLVVLLFLFMAFGPTWLNAGRSIPLLVAGVLVHNVWRIRRGGQTPEDRQQAVQFILWGTLSLALLIKIVAHVQLFHYGFYLALPSALLLIAAAISGGGAACELMSRRLHRPLPAASESFVAGVVVAFVLALAGQGLWISLGNYSYRTLSVGAGANRILVLPERLDARGPAINAFLDWCGGNMEPSATFACLPEGVSLNFLSGHPSSVRYINFAPFAFDAYSERGIVSEFQTHPPDYIVLADRDMSEYGFDHFGVEGYGAELLQWVRREYAPVHQIGPAPFSGGGFGIQILKRRDAGHP